MGVPLQVKLLGPVLVRLDGVGLPVHAPQLQGIVGVLAARSNTVVSRAELIDALWGDLPPAHAQNALHVYVARLRRLLEPDRAHRAPARLLVSTGAGYLLRLEPDQLDVGLVGDHRDRAHSLRAAGDLDGAARSFDAALSLWRGTAWSGVPGPFAQAERNRLGELWLMLFEERAEAMLALGRHRDLVGELRKQTAAHPLREHLRSLLMQALHLSGRRAEALQEFRDTRTALVDELGIEPGPELVQLHQRILAADSAVVTSRIAAPVPRQLPADVANFTGREQHLADLHALLDRHRDLPAPVICAIDGTAGVGKTALAVHFGHNVAGRFPDGQLHIDLRGYAPGQPMSTGEALGRLLRGLGLPPEQIPVDEDEQVATYRSVLAGKRMLVLLDNARGARQVRPLLPGGAGCLIVITSRTTLAGLDGATQMHLDTLPEQQALALLARFTGPDRTRAEPRAATALVALCSRLPLAIRIAGARLAVRPTWPIRAMVERLTDEQRRLDELRVADRAVRASFDVSYQALRGGGDPIGQTAARAFRLLGALDWVDIGVPVAAALLDLSQSATLTTLERLVDDNLLESTTPGRYHAHDLLRLYARDLARREAQPRRTAALRRVLTCYVAAAEQATRLLNPVAVYRLPADPAVSLNGAVVLSTPADATAWVETEHANLLALARQTAGTEPDAAGLAVRLIAALVPPFDNGGHWRDLITLCGFGADTARRTGDRLGEARCRQDLGYALWRTGGTDQAITSLLRALALWREIGDRRGEQGCLRHLAYCYQLQARFTEAIDYWEQALTLCREIGHRSGESAALDGLGLVYQRLRRFEEAIAFHGQALSMARATGDRLGEGAALTNLAGAHRRAGHADRAVTSYQDCLTIYQELGRRYGQAESLWGLGQAHHILGHREEARTYWQRSIAILRDLGELTDDEASALRKQAVPDTPAIIQRTI